MERTEYERSPVVNIYGERVDIQEKGKSRLIIVEEGINAEDNKRAIT